MKTIFTILIFIVNFSCLSQTNLKVNYNKIVDYDGEIKREYESKGTWYLSKDSVLIQKYDNDSLVYNVTKVNGKHVYYKNNFGETVDALFMIGSLTLRNQTRPNEYLIFKRD